MKRSANFCCSECADCVSLPVLSPRRRIAERHRYLAPTNPRPHRSGRSHPLHPHCFAKGVPGEAAPYVLPNSTPCPLTRAQPRRTHTRARPPQSPSPPLLRNGGSGDLRLASVNLQPAHRFAQLDTPPATQPSLALQRAPASRPRTRIPQPPSRHVERAPASRRRTRLANSDVRGVASVKGS